MPDHGGNRTYDLWNASPMLCQLSYAVRSVRACGISELSPVPLTSIFEKNLMNIKLCCRSMLLGSREIVRRFSARARSRSRPTTPKPSATNSEKMIRRSSSRFSRASHGSHKRDRGDVPNESAGSVSKTSMRSSVQGSRAGSGKSHVVELDGRYNHRIGMQLVPDFIVMLCTTLKALHSCSKTLPVSYLVNLY